MFKVLIYCSDSYDYRCDGYLAWKRPMPLYIEKLYINVLSGIGYKFFVSYPMKEATICIVVFCVVVTRMACNAVACSAFKGVCVLRNIDALYGTPYSYPFLDLSYIVSVVFSKCCFFKYCWFKCCLFFYVFILFYFAFGIFSVLICIAIRAYAQ